MSLADLLAAKQAAAAAENQADADLVSDTQAAFANLQDRENKVKEQAAALRALADQLDPPVVITTGTP